MARQAIPGGLSQSKDSNLHQEVHIIANITSFSGLLRRSTLFSKYFFDNHLLNKTYSEQSSFLAELFSQLRSIYHEIAKLSHHSPFLNAHAIFLAIKLGRMPLSKTVSNQLLPLGHLIHHRNCLTTHIGKTANTDYWRQLRFNLRRVLWYANPSQGNRGDPADVLGARRPSQLCDIHKVTSIFELVIQYSPI